MNDPDIMRLLNQVDQKIRHIIINLDREHNDEPPPYIQSIIDELNAVRDHITPGFEK
tara:strand:- start:369 stop:539 length:171 start_codon:yes stop_codon:yes gene_type:complete